MKKKVLATLGVAALFSSSMAVEVKTKAALLKFNGVHYLGYTYSQYDKNNSNATNNRKTDVSRFETRRNYFQVKAYFDKNSKDYARLTLDTKQDKNVDKGSWVVRLKYAYLYLDNVLPYTGVEFGQVHRPWIDYEEHHGWLYRSISETFVETSHAAHVINSASPGIDFKTKTDYFSSEMGLFNDSGYHGVKTGSGQSFEWRLTAHLLGTGKKHVHATKDSWANVSFYGRYLAGIDSGRSKNNMLGIHAVYNNPMFLIAGHIMTNDAPNSSGKDGHGWSINGEIRPIDKVSFLARYDYWKVNKQYKDISGNTYSDYTRQNIIAGVAYQYNKYVKFILNTIYFDPNNHESSDKSIDYMLTAEVKW